MENSNIAVQQKLTFSKETKDGSDQDVNNLKKKNSHPQSRQAINNKTKKARTRSVAQLPPLETKTSIKAKRAYPSTQ